MLFTFLWEVIFHHYPHYPLCIKSQCSLTLKKNELHSSAKFTEKVTCILLVTYNSSQVDSF